MTKRLQELLLKGYFTQGGAQRQKERALSFAARWRRLGYQDRIITLTARRQPPEHFVMIRPRLVRADSNLRAVWNMIAAGRGVVVRRTTYHAAGIEVARRIES